MPNLPSPGTVTDAQQQRIIAAFDGDQKKYRNYLKMCLFQQVRLLEAEKEQASEEDLGLTPEA